MRQRARRSLVRGALLLAFSNCAWALDSAASSDGSSSAKPLPPVSIDEMRVRVRQPSWDTGVLMAACGVGADPAWRRTRFCLGGVIDALYFRKSDHSPAFGGYGQMGTSGFRDFRLSMGVSGLVPLVSWVNLSLRAGPMLVASREGAALGLETFVEVGQRSFSPTGRYSLSHALFTGVQWNAPGAFSQPSGTTIWLGVRFDGYWLSAPALLFQ